MAPEQLRDRRLGFQSDIASLGYVLIEMLTGRLLFQHCRTVEELVAEKLALPSRLEKVLPEEVKRNALLFGLCSKMVAVKPEDRFADADAADLDRVGAASFHRQLIKSDLSTEYDRELAWWIDVSDGAAKPDVLA
jgi:serine/threonine-protein kinase